MPFDKNLRMEDVDPAETKEWREAFDSLLSYHDPSRAQYIVQHLLSHASASGVDVSFIADHPYANTLPESADAVPERADLVDTIVHHNIWNTIAMVMRGHHFASELGGHIGSYASVAHVFEVAFNYFLKGHDHPDCLLYTSDAADE